MPTISLNVPAGLVPALEEMAVIELGVDQTAPAVEKLAAIKEFLRHQLAGKLQKVAIDKGRKQGEATATANLPDLTQIT